MIMATITEDYCDFEIAKLLEEKGFQQLQNNCGYFTTEMVYSINVDKKGEHHFAHQYPAGVYNKDEYIAAPTLQMAMKWLREVHHLLIMIDFECEDCYVADMYNMTEFDECGEHKHIPPTFVNCKTYEQACEAAIKYCLENLI